MLIAVAGPYSAPTPELRRKNLDEMNRAAAAVFRLGHIPVIGVNAALPVVDMLQGGDRYEAIMRISLAIVEFCDGILLIGESPGANRERDLLRSRGKPVFLGVDEIPAVTP